MWHIYNLLSENDTLRASTFRKVVKTGVTGTTKSEKMRLNLTLVVWFYPLPLLWYELIEMSYTIMKIFVKVRKQIIWFHSASKSVNHLSLYKIKLDWRYRLWSKQLSHPRKRQKYWRNRIRQGILYFFNKCVILSQIVILRLSN